MAAKQVLFRSAAREKVLRGATQLADAVRLTLGPKSKSVLIQKKWGTPLVCNDGVTIAKEMELEDPEENLGVQVLRQAAEKTGEAVGDGTSAATILAHAILAHGVRNIAAGASAIDLKRVLIPAGDVATAARGLTAARALLAVAGVTDAELMVLVVGARPLDLAPADDVTVIRADGPLEDAVLATARDRHACVIVMPTMGHDGVLDALLGSHTEHVIRAAGCPVLTVPAASRRPA